MKYNQLTYYTLVAVFFMLGLGKGMAQFDIPPKPSVQTSLYDYIDLLDSSQEQALRDKLVRYSDSTSTQIVVVIIGTTKGEDISFLGAKWGQTWGIGQADKDNGILITLARDDRKVDINTGYGIETIITDRMAEQIINRIMVPEFKKGDYYQGLDLGTQALFAALNGEFDESRNFSKNKIPFGPIIFIVIIILFILLSNRNKGGNNKGNHGGGSLLDVIILSHMGRSAGGFGKHSSGGGWSGGGSFGGGFGGGGFGGGGASGGW